ncbi:MAG TPA: thioesterase family protein [Candidatus Limnocylindrales bacterium]
MAEPVASPNATSLDPGLTGASDRPVTGIDNGYVAGYRVRFDEAGPDGRMRTSALLRYAQDVAWRHSEFLGFDRQWYTQRGRWWVVRAVDLEVLAPTPMGHTLRVSTAVIGHRRIWARRLGECRLADGTLAARVVTDWVILDDGGRLVRIPPDFGLSFTNPELEGDITRVGPAPAPPAASTLRIRVRPHDLDPMDHVNNAVYLDWLEEALAEAGRADAVTTYPRAIRLEYLASAAPGDDVVVRTWRDDASGAGSWRAAIARADGVEFVRATGTPGAATPP